MPFVLEDSKGRELLVVNDNGEFAFSRFPDTDDLTKKELVKIYEALADDRSDGFLDFLNFKNNADKFCS